MSNDQHPQSKEALQGILWGHKTRLEELRKLFFFGENRQDIKKPVIDLFEKDLRKMIEELEGLRTMKDIFLFIESVDAIQENVSDTVDKLTLASSTFGPKETDTALNKRLKCFKDCRPLLKEALEQFKPALKPPLTKADTQKTKADAQSA